MMESGKKKEESLLWHIQRPFVGALIGIFIFLVILLPLKFLDYSSIFLYKLALNLEIFGRLTVLALGISAKVDLPASAIKLVSIAVSAIPAGIAGWQIGSRNPSTRKMGFVFLAGYLLFIFVFGALLAYGGI